MNARQRQIAGCFAAFDKPTAPGLSAMVIHRGRIVFARAFGCADLEARRRCTLRTNFRLASVTKQFTALAILILAERRQLSLNDHLGRFFPEFAPVGKQITLRQLLCHRAGLLDYEDLIPEGTALPVSDWDVLRLLRAEQRTLFKPGTNYHYSNSGYALLALVVEVVSGLTFATFLRRNIFSPLKMDRTLAYQAGLARVPDRAFGYTRRGPRWLRTDQNLTSSVLGDGGVYSSAHELFRWDQALYGSEIAGVDTMASMFRPVTHTDKLDQEYGLGWFLGAYRGLTETWHSGDSVGFTTRISRFPEAKFSVILLANHARAPLDELPHRLADLVLFGGNRVRPAEGPPR